MNGQDGEAGFTLVELLVALAIVGVSAALLFASLAAGGRLWRRGGARSAAGETVAAAQAVLRERIERLAPPDDVQSGAPPASATSATFSFLAAPAVATGLRGTQRSTLYLARDGRLVLGTAGPGRPSALPLIDGVSAIDIAYYGAVPADPVPRWRARWAAVAAPPRLVRVRLRFAAGDLRAWPDLVVRPAVTVSAGCRVDPQQGVCA